MLDSVVIIFWVKILPMPLKTMWISIDKIILKISLVDLKILPFNNISMDIQQNTTPNNKNIQINKQESKIINVSFC